MGCNETTYNCKLYEMAARFINRVRWKTYWSVDGNNDQEENHQPERYNVFKSNRAGPINDNLVAFEEEFYDLIGNIEFKKKDNPLSKKMNNDLKQMKECKKVFMFADKSTNIYKVDKEKYNKLLHENVTKQYKKAPPNMVAKINDEADKIIRKHKIKGKIPKYQINEAFITVKDHKDQFPNKVQCRLLNPSKTHLAKISKSILDHINNTIRNNTTLIQWRNTGEVLDWFRNIDNKTNKHFIKFDIESFYPNITKAAVMKAFKFAKRYVEVTDDDIEIVVHSCKTVLSYNNDIWIKKDNDNNFDVPMGSYHGAELCELMGLFLLDKLRSTFKVGEYGIYRDDGLAVVENSSSSQQERLTKKIRKVFGMHGFKITIEKELKRTEFLDTILDLKNDSHRPYKKPNTKLTYVNRLSNHPNAIKKEIPNIINSRLSQLSSNQHEFDSMKNEYEQALKECNYKERMFYNNGNKNKDQDENSSKRRRKRRRNIIYFQPPYCATVKTPIGKLFLKLVKKHFTKSHPLYKILNPKCIKISYSCLSNIKSKITNINRKVLKKDDNKTEKLCNCRNKARCPVNNKCLLEKVIYKAEVKDKNGTVREYIGSTGNSFKERYDRHKATFKEKKIKRKEDQQHDKIPCEDENKNGENMDTRSEEKEQSQKKTNNKSGTALSRHYLDTVKKDKIEPTIKWSIIGKTEAIPNEKNGCTLCNLEKIAIANANEERTLNIRRELVGACPHFKRQYFERTK